MSRGRGAGRGRGGSRPGPRTGRDSGERGGAAAVTEGGDRCNTCKIDVADDAIGCDKCSNWFHPTSMCLGLPNNVVNNLREYGGEGISFVCTECRCSTDGGTGVNGSAFKQLFETVRGLCETVSKLSAEMRTLMHSIEQLKAGSMTPAVAAVSNDEHFKTAVREEVREMEERQKRKTSIIIRGLDVDSVDHVRQTFEPVARSIVGGTVELSDIVCISREKKLFRAKIADDDCRKQLLENAKSLKNGRYREIYVNKDLTFNQRKELFRRRAERAAAAGGTDVSLNA